jgi:hypothetical protein
MYPDKGKSEKKPVKVMAGYTKPKKKKSPKK